MIWHFLSKRIPTPALAGGAQRWEQAQSPAALRPLRCSKPPSLMHGAQLSPGPAAPAGTQTSGRGQECVTNRF